MTTSSASLEALETDLLQSAEEGDSERVQDILSQLGDKRVLNIYNREKRSSLSLASLFGRTAVVKVLTTFLAPKPDILGEFVNEKDCYGNHSLLLACRNMHKDSSITDQIVRLLIDAQGLAKPNPNLSSKHKIQN